MQASPSTRPPRKAMLWGLGAAVLLAHLWLLGQWLSAPPPASKPAASKASGTATTVTQTTPAPAATPAAPPPAAGPSPVGTAMAVAPRTAAPSPARPPAPEKNKPTSGTRPGPASPPAAQATAEQASPPANGHTEAAPVPTPDSPDNTTTAHPAAPTVAAVATQAETASAPGRLKVPAAAELRYDVRASSKGLSLSAQSVLRWQPAGGSYQAHIEIKALFMGQRSQSSVGTLDPTHGLQPTRFGDRIRSEQATHFDRTRHPPVLRFSSNAPDQPLQAHTQDRLSVLLQLAAMLAGDPGRFGPGQTVHIHTAGPRDAMVWPFKVGNPTALALPIGTLDTVPLARAPMHAFDNRVEVWLAPSLSYLPARILWTQNNGDVVDQQLASHTPLLSPP